MTEWFYVRDGQQFGPVAFEQLVALAQSGGLTGRDSVWNATMTGWTPAGQVPGIFDLYTGPALASSTPLANPVSAPTNPNSSGASNSSNPYAAPESSWSQSATDSSFALTEIEPGSEPIDPIECFSRGYEIFKREFGNILLVGLVYLGVVMGVGMVFAVAQIGVAAITSNGSDPNAGANGLGLFIGIVSNIVQQLVSIFLQLGLIRVGLNLVSGKEVSIGLLFGEGSKILRAIGATILFGLAMVIGLLLLIVPGIYIALRYGHFMTAIVDRDMGVFEAFSYSESITTNNVMNLFVMALLGMVAAFVGAILCLIGLVVAVPVVWLAGLIAYRWMQYGSSAAKDHVGTQTPMLKGL